MGASVAGDRSVCRYQQHAAYAQDNASVQTVQDTTAA